MSSYIDAYKLIVEVRTFFVKLINEAEPLMEDDEEAFDLKIVNPLLEANKAIRRIIREQPRVDVVSKEKYDELNDRYHRLLESATILSDAVREYERREDVEIH